MAEKPPAFEVASVRANRWPDPREVVHVEFLPGGHLSIENVVLCAIVSFAYDVPINPSIRLNGLPDWTRTERFDIEATTDKQSPPPDVVGIARIRKMKLMLQTLLAERFSHAGSHRDQRDAGVRSGGRQERPETQASKDSGKRLHGSCGRQTVNSVS
jgi:uncharacterized protein (TIGR03435 family)